MNIQQELAALRELEAKRTPGLWESDTAYIADGEYGYGDDTSRGFHAFAVLTQDGKTIVETSNSDLCIIEEEFNEDGKYSWDSVGRANAAFIAAAPRMMALINTLAAEVERYRAELQSSTQGWEHIQEAHAWLEQHLKTPAAGQSSENWLRNQAPLISARIKRGNEALRDETPHTKKDE